MLAGSFFLAATAVFAADVSTSASDATDTAWKENFEDLTQKGDVYLPKDWVVKGKPGTPLATFSVINDGKGEKSYLHMEADRASGTLITQVGVVDLTKTPVLKWRWRVLELPEGGDGREKSKDDQAIGIYVGTGSTLNNKSVSYRWDTVTPKDAEGDAAYGAGAVKVKWITLQDKDSAPVGKWVTEERNIAEDFTKAWGFCPSKVYVSVSCNSQYTGSRAAADLDWIELSASAVAGQI